MHVLAYMLIASDYAVYSGFIFPDGQYVVQWKLLRRTKVFIPR